MPVYPKSRYFIAGVISSIAGMLAIFLMEYYWVGNHDVLEVAKKSTSGIAIGVVIAFAQYAKRLKQKNL